MCDYRAPFEIASSLVATNPPFAACVNDWPLYLIHIPDFRLRTEFLKAKSQLSGTRLPDDLGESIARVVPYENLRALEGALNRILAIARFYEVPIAVAFRDYPHPW